jgi:DNA-binding PadR family transcriptional regulator
LTFCATNLPVLRERGGSDVSGPTDLRIELRCRTERVLPEERWTVYYFLRYYSIRTITRGMGKSKRGKVTGLRRANDPPLLILTSLAEGPKHGYALAQDIGEFAGVQLSPGALYGAIARLEERGLIEALPEVERRRPYRLTEAGSSELTQAMRDMRRVVDAGTHRLGLMRGRLA